MVPIESSRIKTKQQRRWTLIQVLIVCALGASVLGFVYIWLSSY